MTSDSGKCYYWADIEIHFQFTCSGFKCAIVGHHGKFPTRHQRFIIAPIELQQVLLKGFWEIFFLFHAHSMNIVIEGGALDKTPIAGLPEQPARSCFLPKIFVYDVQNIFYYKEIG